MDFAKEIEEAGKGSEGNALPLSGEEGYPVKFIGAKTVTSGAGNEMLEVVYKIKPVTKEEESSLKDIKNREVINRYVFNQTYARELLGAKIKAYGGNPKTMFKGVKGLDEYAEVVQDFFDDLSPKPTCRVTVSENVKDPRYPKLFFNYDEEVEIEEIEEEDEVDEVMSP